MAKSTNATVTGRLQVEIGQTPVVVSPEEKPDQIAGLQLKVQKAVGALGSGDCLNRLIEETEFS